MGEAPRNVLVVVGAGGMGLAVARRLAGLQACVRGVREQQEPFPPSDWNTLARGA